MAPDRRNLVALLCFLGAIATYLTSFVFRAVPANMVTGEKNGCAYLFGLFLVAVALSLSLASALAAYQPRGAKRLLFLFPLVAFVLILIKEYLNLPAALN